MFQLFKNAKGNETTNGDLDEKKNKARRKQTMKKERITAKIQNGWTILAQYFKLNFKLGGYKNLTKRVKRNKKIQTSSNIVYETIGAEMEEKYLRQARKEEKRREGKANRKNEFNLQGHDQRGRAGCRTPMGACRKCRSEICCMGNFQYEGARSNFCCYSD